MWSGRAAGSAEVGLEVSWLVGWSVGWAVAAGSGGWKPSCSWSASRVQAVAGGAVGGRGLGRWWWAAEGGRLAVGGRSGWLGRVWSAAAVGGEGNCQVAWEIVRREVVGGGRMGGFSLPFRRLKRRGLRGRAARVVLCRKRGEQRRWSRAVNQSGPSQDTSLVVLSGPIARVGGMLATSEDDREQASRAALPHGHVRLAPPWSSDWGGDCSRFCLGRS